MTTRVGSAPSASKMRSWSSPTGDCTAWVVIARPVRRAARAAARWTRSSRAETHGLSVPISPMIPGRIPVSPTPSVASRTSSSARSSTERRSIERLRRVVGAAVPAAAHHDVEAGRPGEPGQPRRIAADAGEGQVDERRAAGRPERRELLDDDAARRASAASNPSGRDVPERDLRVLVGSVKPSSAGSIGPRTVWTWAMAADATPVGGAPRRAGRARRPRAATSRTARGRGAPDRRSGR